jgi:hypothetical protein
MNPNIENTLTNALGPLYVVAARGEYTRIRTPFWYPDGGVVDVFAKQSNGVTTLTDLGEGLGWLRVQTMGARRSPKQERLLEDICLTQGIERFKGQLMLRCQQESELPRAIVRLGQAVVRVTDLWFTTRTRSIETMTDEVGDLLRERKIDFERSVKLTGRSGREWSVDFQTRTDNRSALVYVLTSGSKSVARRESERVLAAFHDLSAFRVGSVSMRFVSLFDDTADVWADEDFRLVDSVSEVSRWSRPDEFEQMLRAA